MNRTTMPVPTAFDALGNAAHNFPEHYTFPPVVIARPAVIEFRKWLATEHPGFDVPSSARTRTVDVPTYGRVDIKLVDGVQTATHKQYGAPAPQWLVWSVYDLTGKKLKEETWQR